MTASPAPASTVVLLRRRPPFAPVFETYLLRRSARHTFLAGAHVFPGGRVEDEDHAGAWATQSDGWASLTARLAPHLPPEHGLAHAVAAVREIFEETGILLARRVAGIPEAAMLIEARTALLAGRLTFLEWCLASGIRLALDRLQPWAHWITPEIERRRFDAWFFLALVDDAEDASVIAGEAEHGSWMTPREALAAFERHDMTVAPPTLKTLEEVESLGPVDDLKQACAGRSLRPVLPRLVGLPDAPLLVLPGDPAYGTTEPRVVGGSTRFVREGSRWVSVGPLTWPGSR